MSKIALSSDPSGTGTFTIASPNSNTNRTITLQDLAGQLVVAPAALADLATLQIIAVHTASDDTDYTRTATTNAAFGATLTITPVSANSKLIAFATMTGDIDQTGTDNDATGLLTACHQVSDGSYAVWNTQTNNLGIINGDTAPRVAGQITVFQHLNSATDRYIGNIVVRNYGSIAADATSGYAATLASRNISLILVEYI
jgi:hypothetical protein